MQKKKLCASLDAEARASPHLKQNQSRQTGHTVTLKRLCADDNDDHDYTVTVIYLQHCLSAIAGAHEFI